jgi:hypothetical protein
LTASFEFGIGYFTLMVGFFYISDIQIYSIFEAVVYGFVIIEAPEILL